MNRILIFTFAMLIASCKPNFNSEKWKADKSARQAQADDLISRQILMDKTYQEITQLLGEADIHDSIKNGRFTIQYILGGCNWIDFERLVIKFEDGKSNKVYKDCD